MQIEIYNPANGQQLPPVEWNYDAVKAWLEQGLEAYKGRIYTEQTVTEAKKDRANLNKLAEAIDTKRREVKTMYLRPVEEFEAQAKELAGMVKAQSAEIDAQVKAFEQLRKDEKLEKIKAEIYAPMIGKLAGLVPYERLHNPKWLNVTTHMNTVAEELSRQVEKITAGFAAIEALGLDEVLTAQVNDVFLRSFDLAAAIAEKERLIKQQEELERIKEAGAAPKIYDASDPDAFAKAQPGDIVRFGGPGCETAPAEHLATEHTTEDDTPAEQLLTVTFRIHVTPTKLRLLGDFMKANGIRPERV
jgi:hypothetical protein